jgi:hypothetical protein
LISKKDWDPVFEMFQLQFQEQSSVSRTCYLLVFIFRQLIKTQTYPDAFFLL